MIMIKVEDTCTDLDFEYILFIVHVCVVTVDMCNVKTHNIYIFNSRAYTIRQGYSYMYIYMYIYILYIYGVLTPSHVK